MGRGQSTEAVSAGKCLECKHACGYANTLTPRTRAAEGEGQESSVQDNVSEWRRRVKTRPSSEDTRAVLHTSAPQQLGRSLPDESRVRAAAFGRPGTWRRGQSQQPTRSSAEMLADSALQRCGQSPDAQCSRTFTRPEVARVRCQHWVEHL